MQNSLIVKQFSQTFLTLLADICHTLCSIPKPRATMHWVFQTGDAVTKMMPDLFYSYDVPVWSSQAPMYDAA